MDNWEKLGYLSGSCPVAEKLCRTMKELPTLPGVTPGEAANCLPGHTEVKAVLGHTAKKWETVGQGGKCLFATPFPSKSTG